MFSRTESLQQFIRYYPIVSAIILIHILLFLVTSIPIFPNDWVFGLLAGVNFYIAEGELWRFITPIFVHSGFVHTLFNSFSLVLFGPGLELMLGRTKFILLYIVGGVLANVATYILNPLTYIHVGSSGAIFALFGFYVAIVIFKKHMLSKENSQIILTITIIGLVMTFIQPNINITAHVFGLLSGFLIGCIVYSGGPRNRESWQVPQGKRLNFRLGSISPKKLIIYGIVLLLVIIGLLSR